MKHLGAAEERNGGRGEKNDYEWNFWKTVILPDNWKGFLGGEPHHSSTDLPGERPQRDSIDLNEGLPSG